MTLKFKYFYNSPSYDPPKQIGQDVYNQAQQFAREQGPENIVNIAQANISFDNPAPAMKNLLALVVWYWDASS